MGAPAGGAVQGYGKVRNPVVCIILAIVTIGIYGLFHIYLIHEENKRYGGVGPGGVLPLIMVLLSWLFIPIVYLIIRIFALPSEIGQMQAAMGNPKPMSGLTGLWIFFPMIGGLIWFIFVQSAMNEVWIAKGAPA